MALECSQEAVLDFLMAKGGRVKNSELIEHFRSVFPQEPQKKAAVRNLFKMYVDTVAYVKTEDEVKFVCMKKKFRGSVKVTERQKHQLTATMGGDGQVNGDDVPPNTPGLSYGSEGQVINTDEMGNRGSFHRKESQKAKRTRDIPEITVIQASPLPAVGSMFDLPGPADAAPTGQVDPARQVSVEDDDADTRSLSGNDGKSRQHFIQVMMSSSPQVRRSMVFRNSIHLSSKSDSDSVSLISSLEDDRTSVTLDPLEHEWMMCASDGEWSSLSPLLATEPSLILRKDFITGFTCLHWAAKHGKPELIAMIINFAKQHNVPISVDARSNTGYTPLHVAAMHNHMEVVKLLVGAYSADVEIRDYSGRKACQYLTDSVSVDIRDIIGAYDSRSDSENTQHSDGARWRFSRVLQSNLKPLRLLHPEDADSLDGEERPREKPLRRKSSFSRMKPKLQRLRVRTSQIIHSTSFRDHDELEGSTRSSFRLRPKTSFFG
ncbi:ankyrin repeat domain-containing protein SOWAHC-like [Cheilinus undulatus]|uniref:ankyrin repeat domain-containing protein SOWAHC-like n=1 Tax=Cheilinus undulatus TaxID=241271 RepID=UPI001BD23FE5|nr:ankyrin repeat domain-containing protein SOWAHC-like [Cheilinus undulatus]